MFGFSRYAEAGSICWHSAHRLKAWGVKASSRVPDRFFVRALFLRADSFAKKLWGVRLLPPRPDTPPWGLGLQPSLHRGGNEDCGGQRLLSAAFQTPLGRGWWLVYDGCCLSPSSADRDSQGSP